MGAVVDAALGDVDRHVADQPHAALGRVRAQRRPLALEAHLVGDAAAGRAPSRRSSRLFARAEGVELGAATGASGSASRPGQAAKADADAYGEPCSSGGPSGSTCHHHCPAAASQSTNAYASAPSRPPGSEVGCSTTPLDRGSSILFNVLAFAESLGTVPAPSSSNRPPASRSRTSGPRSTAAAIPSSARWATASRSRRHLPGRPRRAARGRPLPARGHAEVARAPPSRSATTAGAGASRSTALGRWQFTVEAWVDRVRVLARRARAQVAAGQEDLRASSPRPRRSSAPATLEELARGGAGARREGPAREDVARRAARGRRRARARPLRRLVRALPALAGAASRASRRRCRSWPSSASTSSTCRRSTPSGRRTARAGTTRSSRAPGDPGSPWAIGGPEGGHDAIHPELGTLEDFDRLVAAARARARDRARLRDPVLPRPPVADGAPGVVQPPARRDAQVRREPAQALPGHLQRQLRLRRLAGALEGAARRRPALVPSTACGPSASTTRTRSRSVLGVADPRGPRASTRSRLLRRGVHAAGDDEDAGEGRLQPVVHVLHLEEHEDGADRVRRRAARAGRGTTGRTSSRTRRTSSTSTCRRAAGRRSRRGSCSRRRCRPATGSTPASRASRTCPSRGQRGVPRLGEVRGRSSGRSTGRCCRSCSG